MLLTPGIRAEIEQRILPENFYITRMEIVRKSNIPDIDSQPERMSGVVEYNHRVFLNIINLDDPVVRTGILIPRDQAIELVYAATFSFMSIDAKINLTVRIVPIEPIVKPANIDESYFDFCANFVNDLRLSMVASYLMREQAKLLGLNVQMAETYGETWIQA
jgi:hypothetical protein